MFCLQFYYILLKNSGENDYVYEIINKKRLVGAAATMVAFRYESVQFNILIHD